uniref:Granulins domain-containing protein n=1 Tax=Ciona savignyi TaxID=51511 RepID=H2YBJ0_CIOSA
MRHAVCCADQKHCCPFGHYCTPFGKCIRMSESATNPQLTNNERFVEKTKTSAAQMMEKLHFSPESDEFTEF